MKVFLTGATGFVGSNVLEALLRNGHSVGCLTRKGSEKKYPEETAKKISIINGDARNYEELVDSMGGYEVVINLIGIIRESRVKGVSFENSNFETTKNLVNAAKENKILRFVHMSGLGASERSESRYHQTKFKAEEYIKQEGMDYTIFSPSVIFGHKDSFVSNIARFVRFAPVVPILGTGEYMIQPVYVGVIAEAVTKCLSMDKAIGKTYEVGGKHKIQLKQVINIIGDALGKNIITFCLPIPVAKIMALIFEEIPCFPFTQDQLSMLKYDNTCQDSEDRFERDFNIKQVGFKKEIAKFL